MPTSNTWILRVTLGVVVTMLAAGATAEDTKPPDVQVKLVPIVQSTGENRNVSIAVEFANRSARAVVFITPQDGSEWGWLDPKYIYTVTPEGGKPLALFPRCGMFGARYDKEAFIEVPPGESRYVMTHQLPFDLPVKGRMSASLTYSVAEVPAAVNNGMSSVKLEKWPAGTFVGTLTSKSVSFDPAVAEPQARVDIGTAHLKGMPGAGKVESGMELTLYPSIKVQAWEDAFVRLKLKNLAETVLDTDKKWKVEIAWTDSAGKVAEHLEYAGDALYYRGELPPTLPATSGLANTQLPIGFQKKPGQYKVRVTLTIEGRGKATSNIVDVEVVPNKLAE